MNKGLKPILLFVFIISIIATFMAPGVCASHTSAEHTLTELIFNKPEASAVEEKIDEIGVVFFNNKKIKEAREAYDALSDTAKEMVSNYDKLQKAETLFVIELLAAAAVVVIILIAGVACSKAAPSKSKKYSIDQ